PGATDDLSLARADLDRDRHLDGAHARHHAVCHHAACGHQSPRRCRAGADPDGRRRYGCAVRRAGGPEDPRRASAPAAWPDRAFGRHPLRFRARHQAGGTVHHPGNRGCGMMRAFSIPALVLAALLVVAPAHAERLIVSVSNHRVTVTPNYSGEELVLFGSVEKDANTPPNHSYDLVVTVSGPRADMVT